MNMVDEHGKEVVLGSNEHMAMVYLPALTLEFAEYDTDGKQVKAGERNGPHLMIRFVSDEAKNFWRSGPTLVGLALANDPGTIVWA